MPTMNKTDLVYIYCELDLFAELWADFEIPAKTVGSLSNRLDIATIVVDNSDDNSWENRALAVAFCPGDIAVRIIVPRNLMTLRWKQVAISRECQKWHMIEATRRGFTSADWRANSEPISVSEWLGVEVCTGHHDNDERWTPIRITDASDWTGVENMIYEAIEELTDSEVADGRN